MAAANQPSYSVKNAFIQRAKNHLLQKRKTNESFMPLNKRGQGN
jgi:hypothetical protein